MDNQIINSAESILRQWKEIIDSSNNDPWFKVDKRQGYQDALNSMVYYGLIGDYNVVTCKATIDGRIDKSLKSVFVPTGKPIQT